VLGRFGAGVSTRSGSKTCTADRHLYRSLRWIDEWTSEDSVAAVESAEAKKGPTSPTEVRKSGYEASYST
jgi:hypothetical protein